MLAKLLSSSSSESGIVRACSFAAGWDEFSETNVSLFFLRACCLANATRPFIATLNAGGRFGSNVASSIFFLSTSFASRPSLLLRGWLLLMASLSFQAGTGAGLVPLDASSGIVGQSLGSSLSITRWLSSTCSARKCATITFETNPRCRVPVCFCWNDSG